MQETPTLWSRLGPIEALYASIFCMAPLLSTRIVDVAGLKLLVGSIAMTFALGLLDVVNEVWGPSKARRVVVTAMVVRFLSWSFVAVTLALPTFREPQGYSAIMGQGIRILVAGEVAMLISQYVVDVNIFAWIKKRMKKGFWIRYNVSNAISQYLSVAMFVFLAFVGTGKPVTALIFGSWVLKFSMSVLLTPVFGFMVRVYARAS